MVSFLSGTRKDMLDSQKQNKVEVLKQRVNATKREYEEGMVKVINEQKLSEPNLTLFTQKKKSYDSQYMIKRKKIDNYNRIQNAFLKTLDGYGQNPTEQIIQNAEEGIEEYQSYVTKQKEMENTKRSKQFEALQPINTKTYQKILDTADLDDLFKKE